MKKELPKTYAPAEFEERIYSAWCDAGYFAPDKDRTKPHYSIVIPPQTLLDNCIWDML